MGNSVNPFAVFVISKYDSRVDFNDLFPIGCRAAYVLVAHIPRVARKVYRNRDAVCREENGSSYTERLNK